MFTFENKNRGKNKRLGLSEYKNNNKDDGSSVFQSLFKGVHCSLRVAIKKAVSKSSVKGENNQFKAKIEKRIFKGKRKRLSTVSINSESSFFDNNLNKNIIKDLLIKIEKYKCLIALKKKKKKKKKERKRKNVNKKLKELKIKYKALKKR